MEPTREILWNIGPGTRAAMYGLAAVTAVVFGYGVLRRVRIWRTGRPGAAIDRISFRLGRLVRHALLQVRLARLKVAGISHAGLLWGFIVLFIGTCMVAVEHYGIAHFLHGSFYRVFSFTLDLFGLLLVAGILIALARRGLARRDRPPTTWPDVAVLLLLLFIAFTGFAIEAFRIVAQRDQSPFETSSFVGWAMAGAIEGRGTTIDQATARHFLVWWVHMIAVYAFLAVIPYTKMLHLVTAPLSIFLTDEHKRSPGGLEPVSIEQVEETGKIGVESAADFTRRQLISFDACTQCGRCENACPAYATGKPLSPMRLVLDLQHGVTMPDSLHDRTIAADTLWACTTCRACVEQCPVLIDHLSVIVDMRRYLVGEGRIRGSEQTALRNVAASGNPWGLPNDDRMAWADGLDVPTVEDNPEPDILLWVGCAGSFDRRNQKVTRALIKIFHAARVNFAVLGKRERCTGDPARRLGDEFTFQEMAGQNVGTLNGVRFKRVVTACAHCFNTLANEYPDFDGHYTVLHHSQFLRELIEQGRLDVQGETKDAIVFHDPCYVGRHNGEYDAPREVLQRGVNVALPILEADRSRETSFCCGAGGGRMWAEEDAASRVNVARWQQLKATGAKTVATACPYCMIMFDDAAKADEASGVQVKDIAEILADALPDNA